MQVKEAAQILGISEVTADEAAKRYPTTEGREGLPVIRIGALRLIVPTQLLQGLLGLDVDIRRGVTPIRRP